MLEHRRLQSGENLGDMYEKLKEEYGPLISVRRCSAKFLCKGYSILREPCLKSDPLSIYYECPECEKKQDIARYGIPKRQYEEVRKRQEQIAKEQETKQKEEEKLKRKEKPKLTEEERKRRMKAISSVGVESESSWLMDESKEDFDKLISRFLSRQLSDFNDYLDKNHRPSIIFEGGWSQIKK